MNADTALTAAFASMYNADGQFPPPPPGYDRDTWLQGTVRDGKHYVEDPITGRRYIIHAEDKGHWRHWDVQDPDDKGGGGGNSRRWPEDSLKTRDSQKRPPYGGQNLTDPNGDKPGWTPFSTEEVRPIPPLSPAPGLPGYSSPATRVPFIFRAPIFIP
jgi:hypothetical protein